MAKPTFKLSACGDTTIVGIKKLRAKEVKQLFNSGLKFKSSTPTEWNSEESDSCYENGQNYSDSIEISVDGKSVKVFQREEGKISQTYRNLPAIVCEDFTSRVTYEGKFSGSFDLKKLSVDVEKVRICDELVYTFADVSYEGDGDLEFVEGDGGYGAFYFVNKNGKVSELETNIDDDGNEILVVKE